MRNIANTLSRGQQYFGSGSSNSETFIDFAKTFKKSFKKELKKINATDIEVSVGHFYLSGFFTVQGQAIYFSISDVRDIWGGKMLIRTAKDYQDYTGGANNYFDIVPDMSKRILRIFGLDQTQFTKAVSKQWDKAKVADKLVAKLKDGGEAYKYVTSGRRASFLIWAIASSLGIESLTLSDWKRGRYLVKVVGEKDGLTAYYDANSKTLSLTYNTGDIDTINTDEIAKVSRRQDKTETIKALQINRLKFMCWGANSFEVVSGNIVRFNVHAHHHKGFVYIAVNGSDLYDVYLTSLTNVMVNKIEDVYFDELTDRIDDVIEKIAQYVK